MRFTSSLAKALTPTAVALGNFDGLHLGHQRVIQPILDSTEHIYSTVVTFDPHPQEFFTGQRRPLLTPLDEKVQQLTLLGVKQLVLLPFNGELAALSPQEFVEKILLQQLRAQQISVGEDFCFGKQRRGTAIDLKAIASTFNIPVTMVPLHTCEGDRISSSSIRRALEQGDLEQAKALLGRPYTLTGYVVKGQQLGRKIGFPTANLQLPTEKFLPRQGVYAVRVLVEEVGEQGAGEQGGREQGSRGAREGIYSGSLYEQLPPASKRSEPPCSSASSLGVMNIGNRPTVNGIHPSVEVHLLDWSDDLYGKTLTVQLEKFLRPEQKFASLEALIAQIQVDCAIARSQLTLES